MEDLHLLAYALVIFYDSDPYRSVLRMLQFQGDGANHVSVITSDTCSVIGLDILKRAPPLPVDDNVVNLIVGGSI